MPPQETFEPHPSSAGAVRSFVVEALTADSDHPDIVLAASELATNVIRHANTSFTVSVTDDHGWMRLEVRDGSPVIPAPRDPSEGKRGLRMIEAMADDWGVEPTDDGKVVWVRFDRT